MCKIVNKNQLLIYTKAEYISRLFVFSYTEIAHVVQSRQAGVQCLPNGISDWVCIIPPGSEKAIQLLRGSYCSVSLYTHR